MANRLKYQRTKSRLTQAEVAKLLDTTEATVSRHESAERGLNKEWIEKYAHLYKVSSVELFVEVDTNEDD